MTHGKTMPTSSDYNDVVLRMSMDVDKTEDCIFCEKIEYFFFVRQKLPAGAIREQWWNLNYNPRNMGNEGNGFVDFNQHRYDLRGPTAVGKEIEIVFGYFAKGGGERICFKKSYQLVSESYGDSIEDDGYSE